MDDELRQLVAAAALRADVLDAVRAIYSDVQQEIDRRRPVCVVSGRCCRFEEFGHRLFVTTAELALFVHELVRNVPADGTSPWDGTGCPLQSNKLCTVHTIRPFGCRMFFCDATSTDWQNETYERFHTRLKQLHDELAIPYRYVEWREALRRVGLFESSSPASGTG